MLSYKFLIFALVGIAVASPFDKRELRTKHEWTETPSGWEDRGPACQDAILDLQIGLKQDRLDELIEHLNAVSDPAHERYGAHLSKEDVDALVAPHEETVALVDEWLSYHEIDFSSVSRSDSGDWLFVSVTVEQAERMLGASYHNFHNSASDTTVVRTLRYRLPAVLHDHIKVVAPTTYLSGLHSMKSTVTKSDSAPITQKEAANQLSVQSTGGSIPQSCNETITPACLKEIYGIWDYLPKGLGGLAIAGFLEQFASFADLKEFYKLYQPVSYLAGFNFTEVSINGSQYDPYMQGGEANLDTQYGGAMSFPIRSTYYSTAGSPPFIPSITSPTNTNEPYLVFLNYVLAEKPLTFTTLTISYGDEERTVPPAYAEAVCNGFAQLGARGVSVLVSSGDAGVGPANQTGCVTNDGTNRTQFLPGFPVSCPFVTAVGGTQNFKPEVGANYSGGGFSNYFAQPYYQSTAVKAYLKYIGNTYEGLYNSSGRAYPDVSAQSNNFEVVYNGTTQIVYGTSCSSPTFAGIISVVNDALLAEGKPPLGFLNPFLYSVGWEGLNDILLGSNPGCGTPGFNATKGWDPVTGLGTPNFPKLLSLALTGSVL